MPVGFSKACRTCLTLDGTLISIYDSISYDGGGSVTDIIKDITKIKPMKSDGLPELVCQTCLNEINRCYSFKVKCLNSDNILRKLSANEDELDLSHRQQVAEEGEKDCKPIVQNLMIVQNPDPIEPEYEIPIKIKTEIDQDDQSFGYFVITSVCSQNDQTNETDDAATIKTFQTPPQGFIKEEVDYELDSYNTSSTRRLTCTDVYTSDQSMYFDNISLELARPQLKLEPEESFQLESPIINATLKPNIKCSECDKEFLYSSQLKKHMRSHNSKPLACPTCNKTFKFQAQLRSHVSVSHRLSNPFKCEVCPRSFPFPSKLKEHLRSHKGIPYIQTSCERKMFKCEDCPRTFYFPSKLKEHLRSHRNKNLPQTVVDKHHDELSSKDIATESEQKYEQKDVGTSLDASANDQSTIWVYENQRSTRRSARIQREELKTPDGETDQPIQSQSHENNTETKEIKIQTKKQEKLKQVENSLDEQFQIPDEESTRSYNCPHCTKVFKYLSRLNEHIVCHSESRPFDCTNCGKFFKSPGQLARHLKTSHKIVSFRSRRKTFGRRGNFKNKAIKSFIRNKIDNGINNSEQISVHQNEEEQKTEAEENQKGTNKICEENLDTITKDTQNNEETEHLQSDLGSPSKSSKHPKRKTISPTSPESPDSSNTSKAKNNKTLDEEKTYRCEQCDITFHVSSRFYSHMRVKHGIERPFACQLCGRGFKSCGNLRSHVMITHEKLKPFKCNNCKRTFSCKSNLKKHFASRVWNHSCGKEFNSRRAGIKKKISDRRRLNYEDETADSNENDESKHRNKEETAIESTNESLFINENTDLNFKSNTETLDDEKADGQEVSVLSVETRVETTADNLVQSESIKPVQEESIDKKPTDFKSQQVGKKDRKPANPVQEEAIDRKPTDFKPQQVCKKDRKPKNPLECPQCNKVFVYYSYLKKHLHSHSNDRPFKCTICGKCFKYKVSLKSHYMVEHAKNKPFKCDKCPQEFVNEYNYRVHRNAHIKAIKRKADAKQRLLTKEISGKTEEKSPSVEKLDKCLEVACEQTGNVDIEKIDQEKSEKLTERVEEAQNSVELSCVPGSSLNTSTHSNAEQVQHDEPKSTFECPHCDKVYLFASYLKKHMRCHNDERPHVCKTCGKSFKEYWRLRSHVMAKHALTLKKLRKKKRNHLNEKPLVEQKQTQSLGSMNVQDGKQDENITESVGAPVSVLPSLIEENRHVVENEKPHCTQCDRVFQYASQLETHMRSHTGERPYSCPTCNKTFKQTGHLRTHIHLTHKDLKPFQCTMCLRGFDDLHHLRAHEKSHRKKLKNAILKSEKYSTVESSTAESVQKAQDIIQDQIIEDFEKLELHPLFGTSMFEPNSCLKCSECAQTFELQSDLDEHMKTHSLATRPFNCSICYKTFKQEAHLKNHTKMSHTKTRNYKCNECNRTFLTFYILSKHMRSHKSKKNSSNGKSKRGHKRRGKINKHKNLFEPLDISITQVTPPEPEKEPDINEEPKIQTDSSAVKNNVQTNCALCSALVDSHNLSEHMKECLQTPTANHFEMKPEPLEQTQRKDHPLFESLSNQDDDKTDTGVVKQCSECNTEFCSFSTFAEHMLTHQVERPFVCSTCGKAFKKNAHLRNHIMVVHKRILPYKCDDCPRVFSSKYNLNIHSKTHIAHRGKRRVIMKKNYYKDPPYHPKPPPNENINSTTTINQKTDDDYSNKLHLSRSVSIENENIVRCTLCFISVQSDSLSKHMQEFHNLPESLTCVTVKKENLEDTIIKQQPVASETSSKIEMTPFDLPQKRLFKCPTCDKEFPHLSRLNEHMRGHSDERPFICLVCGNTYKRHGHLTTHIATCHKRDKPFKCKKCPRTFSNRLNLNIHSQTHLVDDMTDYSVTASNLQSDMHLEPLVPTRDEQLPAYNVGGEGLPQFTAEESHPCTFCPTVLKSLTQLMEHMKVHTSDQPFICSLCGKAFNNNDDLASHRLLKHNTSKPYQCDQCDRDFTSSVGLKKHHLWIHNTAYKQMRFKKQNKKTNTKRNNEEQQQKHSSDVPQCYVCKKNFTNNWVLKEHMKTHPHVRPFTCLICGHSFAKKYNLKIHVMGHRKIRPFKCRYCPQAYCTNYLLKHHMRTHTQEPKEIQNDESHSESLNHNE